MGRMIGTVSMGVRAPIIREGDNLVEIVTDCIAQAMESDGLKPRDRDIVAMTEAIVARAQGNYCSVDNIADDVRAKLGGETWRHLPDSQPQPLRHLPARHRQGRQEGRPDAELSVRRGGQPSGRYGSDRREGRQSLQRCAHA